MLRYLQGICMMKSGLTNVLAGGISLRKSDRNVLAKIVLAHRSCDQNVTFRDKMKELHNPC